MLTRLAATLFAILAAAGVAFQLALACGAPWAELTLGGRYRGKLPPAMRVVPLVSAALLAGFAVIVLARSGLAFGALGAAPPWLAWCVAAYCAVGALANAVTPSRRERALWLPIVLVMLVSSIIVAMH